MVFRAKLLQPLIKSLFRYTVKFNQAVFGITPKQFDAVNVLRTPGELVCTMMYPEVLFTAHIDQAVIAAPAVSIDDNFNSNPPSNNLLQCSFRSIRHDFGIDFVVPF
ncbi:hypothetical protein AABM17_861 [Neisseria musculi]|uniref:Uncharacterized protein n=1 Tax=Neisseria musculi TaxID=1815583 RepID=A0A7H1MCW2_9NEIS|nr:hypothetical protein H7A79_0861 [Neisseria musculi]